MAGSVFLRFSRILDKSFYKAELKVKVEQMERIIDLSTVKDCSVLRECGDYVVASGKSLWVFRKDGTFVSKSNTIRRPHKLHFLPPDKIFVEGGADYQYHYVDLVTGEDIWTTPINRKRMLPSERFAASPDNRYLYDMYLYGTKEKWYMLRFSLADLSVSKVQVPKCLRTTTGIYTDDEGILYALQTHGLTGEGKISQNGILRIDWRTETPIISWERMWQSERSRKTGWNCTDGHYILCNDFSVIDMATMESFNLLENETEWKLEGNWFSCEYIPDRGMLLVYNGTDDGNVVIDCKARKRVAQYAYHRTDTAAGYAGYLIGDEYWIGTENGIARKPFPVFEEMPEKVSDWWLFTREMERIRGKQLEKQARELYVKNYANHMTMKKNGEYEAYCKYRVSKEKERRWSLYVKRKLVDEIRSGSNLLQVVPLAHVNLPRKEIIGVFSILSSCELKDEILAAIEQQKPFFEPDLYEDIVQLWQTE